MVQVDYYFSVGAPNTYLAIAAGVTRFWRQDPPKDAALHLGAA